MPKMIVYWGRRREAEIECDVEILGDIVGRIICLECGGDGDWKKFLSESQITDMCPGDMPYPCVDCKGTGKILVGI